MSHPGFQILLLTWLPGKKGAIHTHGESACAFKFLKDVNMDVKLEKLHRDPKVPSEDERFVLGEEGKTWGAVNHFYDVNADRKYNKTVAFRDGRKHVGYALDPDNYTPALRSTTPRATLSSLELSGRAVGYIQDDLGAHSIDNYGEHHAYSVHIYFPPYAKTFVFTKFNADGSPAHQAEGIWSETSMRRSLALDGDDHEKAMEVRRRVFQRDARLYLPLAGEFSSGIETPLAGMDGLHGFDKTQMAPETATEKRIEGGGNLFDVCDAGMQTEFDRKLDETSKKIKSLVPDKAKAKQIKSLVRELVQDVFATKTSRGNEDLIGKAQESMLRGACEEDPIAVLEYNDLIRRAWAQRPADCQEKYNAPKETSEEFFNNANVYNFAIGSIFNDGSVHNTGLQTSFYAAGRVFSNPMWGNRGLNAKCWTGAFISKNAAVARKWTYLAPAPYSIVAVSLHKLSGADADKAGEVFGALVPFKSREDFCRIRPREELYDLVVVNPSDIMLEAGSIDIPGAFKTTSGNSTSDADLRCRPTIVFGFGYNEGHDKPMFRNNFFAQSYLDVMLSGLMQRGVSSSQGIKVFLLFTCNIVVWKVRTCLVSWDYSDKTSCFGTRP